MAIAVRFEFYDILKKNIHNLKIFQIFVIFVL